MSGDRIEGNWLLSNFGCVESEHPEDEYESWSGESWAGIRSKRGGGRTHLGSATGKALGALIAYCSSHPLEMLRLQNSGGSGNELAITASLWASEQGVEGSDNLDGDGHLMRDVAEICRRFWLQPAGG